MTSHTTQADLEIMDAEEYSNFLAYGEEDYQELDARTQQELDATIECVDLTDIESCQPSVLEFKSYSMSWLKAG